MLLEDLPRCLLIGLLALHWSASEDLPRSGCCWSWLRRLNLPLFASRTANWDLGYCHSSTNEQQIMLLDGHCVKCSIWNVDYWPSQILFVFLDAMEGMTSFLELWSYTYIYVHIYLLNVFMICNYWWIPLDSDHVSYL